MTESHCVSVVTTELGLRVMSGFHLVTTREGAEYFVSLSHVAASSSSLNNSVGI
jgi:hypothetical protein